MVGKLLFLTVTVLLVSSCIASFKKNRRGEHHIKDLIDIDSKDDEPEIDHSGIGDIDTDDEDLFEGSADDDDDLEISGSGHTGFPDEITTLPQSTRSLSECEQLRNSIEDTEYAKRMKSFVPRCTADGQYERLQCQGEPGIDECWCVFPDGNLAQGTTMHGPSTPDCQFGSTLKKCIFLLLKNSWGNHLGTYRPRCTIDGEFENIQCFEGDCWCVNHNGIERQNTRVRVPGIPICEEITGKPATTRAPNLTDAPVVVTTKRPHPDKKTPVYEIQTEAPDIVIVEPEVGVTQAPVQPPKRTDAPTDVTMKPFEPIESEEDNSAHGDLTKDGQTESNYKLLAKPFVMGAVIAGAVVGLLGAILLVMFIVYRMRKKDEGSYALEEQKFTNYSYMKAPEKEFYA